MSERLHDLKDRKKVTSSMRAIYTATAPEAVRTFRTYATARTYPFDTQITDHSRGNYRSGHYALRIPPDMSKLGFQTIGHRARVRAGGPARICRAPDGGMQGKDATSTTGRVTGRAGYGSSKWIIGELFACVVPATSVGGNGAPTRTTV